MAGVASSRMGDHPGFLATNPCHTYKNVFSTVPPLTNKVTTYKQTKNQQLMVQVAGLKYNKKKSFYCVL